jgi:O-antigen ligase
MNQSSNMLIRSDTLPRSFLEWLLVLFILGLMTLSSFKGLSRIMVLYGLVFCALYLIYIFYFKLKLPLPPEAIIYFSWIAWSFTGLTNAVDENLYFQLLGTIIQMGVMICLVAGIVSWRQDMSIIMFSIAIGGIIVLLSSVYTGEFQTAVEIESRTQAAGLTRNANSFAYHLLFIIFTMFFFWESKSSLWWRVFQLTIVAISVIGIIYSGSRKGFLGILVFLSLWFLFCQGKRLLKNPVITFTILLVLSIGIYYTTDYVMSDTYMGERFEHAREHGSETRVQLYKEGIKMIKSNPIVGVGLSNYIKLSSSGLYSHSDYIEVAATTGIVGKINDK